MHQKNLLWFKYFKTVSVKFSLLNYAKNCPKRKHEENKPKNLSSKNYCLHSVRKAHDKKKTILKFVKILI